MVTDSQHIPSHADGPPGASPRPSAAARRIGIHGATPAIARSLAYRFVHAGASVALIDSELRRAEKAFHDVASRLQNGRGAPGELAQRIEIGQDLETLNRQSIVFHVPSRQASPEVITREIQHIESILSAEPPIVTMLHDSEQAAAITPNVEGNARLFAMHIPLPRFPVPFGQLVHGQAPSSAAHQIVRDVLESIGVTPVETPHALGGLLLDRQFIPVLNEACRLLRASEASIEALDRGFPIPWLMHLGPLQAADLLGIDQVISTGRVLTTLTGDSRFDPHPLLLSLEDRGYLGWKNGRGFYDYALDD